MSVPILVTGARGNVGQWVVRELISVGLPVRAAVRHPGRTEPDAATSGVDWVRFDFTDPSTWAAAFTGSRVMFLVRPPQISQVKRDLLPAVRAAYAAGVRHVVFLSLQGADRNLVVPHAQVERSLRNSPLGWTFIRASFFMQNLSTTHAVDIRDRSQILVPAGHGRTAFVDAADVASVAAAALRDPQRHAGRAWIPTGPDAISYERVAEIMSEVLGRPVCYPRPGMLSYARHAHQALGMPWGMVGVTAAIYTAARCGLAAGLTGDVQLVTGRAPNDFRAFATRERSAWHPGPNDKDG